VRDEWRTGWPVAASSFVGNGLGFNLFLMSAGLFVIPLQEELGVPRTAVMISTMAMLLASLLSPVAAVYLDRYGPRKGVLFGFGLLILAYFLLAVLPASTLVYYAVAVVFVIAGTITGTMAFCKGISLVFQKGAGIAFGVGMSGVSLVSALLIPLLSYTIETYGWRAGYGTSAVLLAVIGLPVLLLMFKPPAATTASAVETIVGEKKGEAWQAMKTTRFWLLAVSISCGTFCIGGMISQLYPMFVGAGLSLSMAAALMSTYAGAIGLGRIIVGFLLDRLNPTGVAATCMLATSAGTVLLLFVLGGSLPIESAFLAALLLGWGQGSEGDFPAFFTLRMFGRENFAKVFSGINIFAGGFTALGGIAFAAVYDWMGTYSPVIALSAGLWTIAAALIVILGRVEHRTLGNT